MLMFIKELVFTLSILVTYGLIGGFAIIPFRKNLKYPILAAPMPGMLLWSLGVFMLYCYFGLSLGTASHLIALLCVSTTIICLACLKINFSWQTKNIIVITFLFVLIAVVTYLINVTSIKFGHDGFLYREGTDHLGYASMADWLKTHTIKQLPIVDPSVPMQSFLGYLVGFDPRFGSIFNLGIIATLLNKSSTFSYDIACSIVMLTGILGVASLYSRSRATFFILICALLVNHWFYLSRTGYFGKIMGFTAMTYILGLYFIQQQNDSLQNSKFAMIITFILTFAAAMVYPGYVLAIFLSTVGGLFLLSKAIGIVLDKRNRSKENLIHLRDSFGLLAVMIIACLATAGKLAQPSTLSISIPAVNLDWLTIFIYQFDMRLLVSEFAQYTQYIHLTFYISISIIVFSLLFAIIKKNSISISLIGSTIILCLLCYFKAHKYFALQFTGTLYTLSICGFIWLLDDYLKHKNASFNKKIILAAVVILAISIRIPAFVESIHRYSGQGVPPTMQYSQQEMSNLAKTINSNSIIVDIPNVMWGLPIMVEFGLKDNINLQWSQESWRNTVASMRNWQVPRIIPTHYILGVTSDVLAILGLDPVIPDRCNVIFKTSQYQLFKCQDFKDSLLPLTYRKHQA